jgi:hypothetical protein
MRQGAILAIAASLAIGTIPAAAWAGTYDLGTIPANTTVGEVVEHKPGAFTDTITFKIQSGGAGIADYYNFYVLNGGGKVRSNIIDAALNLTGPTAFSTSLTSGTSYPIALLAGSYTATITGKAVGANGGAYNFDVTAPTPEPATMALMAGGIAMSGFMARRRRRAQA